jgi:hypothetical protein
MYPISTGIDAAVARIEKLIANGHDAEALVTCVFTLEKIVRRALRFAILARGFSGKQADLLLDSSGI